MMVFILNQNPSRSPLASDGYTQGPLAQICLMFTVLLGPEALCPRQFHCGLQDISH
jgi:hypothetical protein